MSNTEANNQLENIQETLQKQYSESVNIIEDLARKVDSVRLFIAVIANMCFGIAEHMTEINYGTVPVKLELLAYFLFPFFDSPGEKNISPYHVNECMAALDILHTAYTWSEGFRFKPEEIKTGDRIATEIRARAMSIRGSAYPEQTLDEIMSIQGIFEDWFVKRLGIGPKRACDILFAIMHLQEENYNNYLHEFRESAESFDQEWKEAKKKWLKDKSKEKPNILKVLKRRKIAWLFGYFKRLNELAPGILPADRSNLKMKSPPSIEEWEALKNLIGLTKDSRQKMSSPIEVRDRILFCLPNDKVILGDISHALDLIWETFDKVAKSDQEFYDKRYQRQKAQWLEKRVVDHLSKMFPSNNIYRTLDYPDPNKSDGSTAELDIAVDWGPFLVLIEAKARQFRMESQLGDLGRLRTDIKLNIEDAFEQARRAVKYISSKSSPEFIERRTGRRLGINKDRVRRIYMITVSQHHLSGLATELANLKDLGFFKDGEYPIAISEGDLDIISEFCNAPDVFLHYLERRLYIQKISTEIHADELDLFGAYLDCRLQAQRLWKREEEEANRVALMGFSEIFDKWMMYRRGDLESPPIIQLNIPKEIAEVLKSLRERNHDSARWISFALLDMSDNTLQGIAKAFRELKVAKITPGMFRRLVHKDGGTVISFTASLDLPLELLRQRTAIRTQIEKYRHKATKSIGFGIMVLDHSRLFDCVFYAEGPWEYDERLEKALKEEPPFFLAPGQQMPSKKSLCPCGSGEIFEKCCFPRMNI